jgi:FkbM family methyltransferase
MYNLKNRIEHKMRLLKHCYLKPEPEMLWLRDLKLSIDTAIDCGANRGYISHMLAKNAKRVISIEPIPHLADYLNTVLPKNCEIINAAISDCAGYADLKIPIAANGNHITALATISENNILKLDDKNLYFDTVETKVFSLEELVLEKNLKNIGYLKIDAEGHEGAILAGAWSVIESHEVIVQIELEERHGTNVLLVFKGFEARGFGAYWVHNKHLRRVDYSTFIENQRSNELGQSNYMSDVIFFKDGAIERHNLSIVS